MDVWRESIPGRRVSSSQALEAGGESFPGGPGGDPGSLYARGTSPTPQRRGPGTPARERPCAAQPERSKHNCCKKNWLFEKINRIDKPLARLKKNSGPKSVKKKMRNYS